MTSDLPVISAHAHGHVVNNSPPGTNPVLEGHIRHPEARRSPKNNGSFDVTDGSNIAERISNDAISKRQLLHDDASKHPNLRLPILRNGVSAPQRGERCQVLKVKFGKESVSYSVSNGDDSSVQPVDTRLEVDHQHYEQWARVPTRRTTNSVLLRGIQHLKAKMKRDGSEDRENDFLYNVKVSNAMIVKEKTIDDAPPHGFPLRRERSFNLMNDNVISKPTSAVRDFLKPNQHVIDADMFENEHRFRIEKVMEHKPEVTSPRDSAKEQPKPRLGISRLRDRCPVPVTLHQPLYIGDHVFLVSDPSRNIDFPRSRTRTELQQGECLERTSFDPISGSFKLPVCDARLASSMEMAGEGYQRSRSFFGSFPPKKTQTKRTPATVSSAEVFDFSHLVEIRRSNELKVLERQKTESSFSVRPSRSSRWVPKNYKMKEHIH